jgi:hypothetical protein
MRPPRLLLLIFCFIFLPILLTFLSLVTAEPRRDVGEGNAPVAGRSSRLRALFSFNTPTSLFPPSAIISLTDDNSTFFLARPAAFGPLLPSKGLSGQLWIGSGFNEDTLRKGVGVAGFQGELGCSDVPGWDKDGQAQQDKVLKETHTIMPTNPATDKETIDKRKNADTDPTAADKSTGPAPNDGTDDHLHHPFSAVKDEKSSEQQPPTHADIQSLQESAEIAGKVVLLSRGGCGFLEKVKWVQRRGGAALIVGDDTRGGSLITMYARGDTSNITIPAVFTSYTTAHLLSSLIPESASLEGQETDPKKVSADQKRPSKPTTTTTKITSQPTNTKVPKKDAVKKEESPKTKENNLFSAIWSLFGFGRDESLTDDSRRPPSSGNIDWVLVDDYEEEEDVSKSKLAQSSKYKGAKTDKTKKVDNSPVDGDGFEIGVHDWRDPDLVPTKSSAKGESSSAEKTESKKKDEKADSKTDSNLKGGIITPGSGEYSHVVKVPAGADKTDKNGADSVDGLSSDSDEKSWFVRHFGWNQGLDDEMDQILKNRVQPTSIPMGYVREGEQILENHPGLWVTLTPTSMSTSPFFDTLLVLVVSPLITLTVVYALLLLRSRIRRRRWRAPKSVVERLPIRTYHTITQSTSTSSSPRSPSPGSVTSVTSTSPLLGSRPREAHGRSRQRSQTVSGVGIRSHDVTPIKEGTFSGSDLWRRKYIGRQVECVVCLEEYVDGQSQVMSLPCGHEFHAECM